MRLTKSLLRIDKVLQNIVEANAIKEAVWKMDVGKFPMTHI